MTKERSLFQEKASAKRSLPTQCMPTRPVERVGRERTASASFQTRRE